MKVKSKRVNALEIQTVKQDDNNNILEVYRQCEDFLALGPQPKASLEMVVKDIEDSRNEEGIFRGIYINGKMVGVVSYVPNSFEGKPHNAFISLLMITPAFRGQGIGTRIVETVEKEILMNSQISTILSAVQVNNPRALRFWQKNDYRIVGEPELRPDNTTVFHLRKDLKTISKI